MNHRLLRPQPLGTILLSVILAGCGTTAPPAYDKDKTPEERQEYNGLEGAMQNVKDQSYLLRKEVREKCEEARIADAIAVSQGDVSAEQQQQRVINKVCWE